MARAEHATGGVSPPEPVVCELGRRGKFLVANAYFDPRHPITIDRKAAHGADVGDLVVVSIARRRARVEKVLGRASAIEAVLAGLLVQTGMSPVHGRAGDAMREADGLPSEPEGVEPGRVDLRDLLAFTIDPDGAKDFDDAISVRREGERLRVWVHIADVSRYVASGSALDRDAAERALSVYVPGTVEPMLPERLSNGLCSLVPGRERLCVTVEVVFDASREPGEPVFYRSVIRSDERLTYTQAEAILSGHDKARVDVAEALALADGLAVELRQRRHGRGSLWIETGEISFAFDGRGGVGRAWIETEPRAHALVEEFMILANEAVGGLLAGRRRDALYRVHERPDPQSIELLLAKLAALEVPTPPLPEHLTPAEGGDVAARVSLRVAEYTTQSGRGKEAFPSLVLRALKQARYAPSNLGHSGLASRAYCHFTSPIRRYPDVVCHRALLRELGVADDPQPDDLPELAEWTSVREREATKVEHTADSICLAWYLDRRLFELGWDTCFEGEIIGAIGSGIFIRFGDVFEGYVPARRLPGDYFELDPLGTALIGRRSGRRYRLGDSIEVRVERIERETGKVNLALCENSLDR